MPLPLGPMMPTAPPETIRQSLRSCNPNLLARRPDCCPRRMGSTSRGVEQVARPG